MSKSKKRRERDRLAHLKRQQAEQAKANQAAGMDTRAKNEPAPAGEPSEPTKAGEKQVREFWVNVRETLGRIPEGREALRPVLEKIVKENERRAQLQL